MKLFTLVLGVSVAIVAWLQWWVALNKLRLDLFDRRYKVYEATLKFFWESVQHSPQIDLYLGLFNFETLNAEFLFDTDVVNYLEHVRRQAQKEGAAIWLSDPDRRTETTKTFAPYLGFANVKI